MHTFIPAVDLCTNKDTEEDDVTKAKGKRKSFDEGKCSSTAEGFPGDALANGGVIRHIDEFKPLLLLVPLRLGLDTFEKKYSQSIRVSPPTLCLGCV